MTRFFRSTPGKVEELKAAAAAEAKNLAPNDAVTVEKRMCILCVCFAQGVFALLERRKSEAERDCCS